MRVNILNTSIIIYAIREEKTPNDGKNAGQISEPPDTVAILVANRSGQGHCFIWNIASNRFLWVASPFPPARSTSITGGKKGIIILKKKPSCASSVPHISLSEEKGRHKELKK